MIIDFSCRGNVKQLEAFKYWNDNESEQILFGGAKYGAKTFTGCALTFGDALTYPKTRYFISRKELVDLRKHTIPSIHEFFDKYGVEQRYYKYNGQDSCYELYNGSMVLLLACTHLPSDPMFERFGSMQMTRGWIEEGGEVSEDAYKNLWLSVGRWMNEEYGLKKKLFITANPKKNWLYRDFYKPSQSGTLPINKKYIQSFVYDNKTTPADYIKTLEGLSGVQRQRLLLGNWEYDDSDNALIPYDAILDSFHNSHIAGSHERFITADIALEGSDHFTIAVWEGWQVIHFERILKIKPQEVIAKIEKLKNEFHVPNSHIVYDADGLGTYVGGWVIGAKAFHNGAAPVKIGLVPENYKNQKTQCYYRFAKRVSDHAVWLKALATITDIESGKSMQELCIEEMEQIKSALGDKEGKLCLIDKSEVKANIGRSPDITDCLIMREYLELFPTIQGPRTRK